MKKISFLMGWLLVLNVLFVSWVQGTIQKIVLFNKAHSAILVCFSKKSCKPLWKHTIEPQSEKALFSADLKYRNGKPLYITIAINGHNEQFTLLYDKAPSDCQVAQKGNSASNLVKIRRGSSVIDTMEYDANTHELSLVFDNDETLTFNRLVKPEREECVSRCHSHRIFKPCCRG